jgi:molybdate transport system regulatory protein
MVVVARTRSSPRIRLLHRAEIALGPGKVELLELIDSLGSISAAGRQMGMSYRRAWLLIDTMNRCFRQPVVEASKGGVNGGGASVTPFGLRVLNHYHRLETHAAREFEKLLTAATPGRSRRGS